MASSFHLVISFTLHEIHPTKKTCKMANGSEGSKLSTAANIIGLLTFALSALNLVIVRVLQNERRVIQQLHKREWINSCKAFGAESTLHPAF